MNSKDHTGVVQDTSPRSFLGRSRHPLLITVFLVLLIAVFALAGDAPAYAQGCVGSEECYEDPPPQDVPVVPFDAPLSPWEGFSDGRLNPAMGEYYSLWCSADMINVWRAVPEDLLIKQINLAEVIALEYGALLAVGDFMTVVRQGEDVITIYGSNGNRAPEPGEKTFSLQECISRNGGAPQAENTGSEALNEPPFVPPAPPLLSVGAACTIGEFFEGEVLPDGTCYISPTEFLFRWVFFLAGLLSYFIGNSTIVCVSAFFVPGGLSFTAWRIRQRL